MVRRAAALAALALAGLPAGARAAAASPVEAPQPAAPAPPDLVRLEQAMLAFPLTSERFSASVGIASNASPRGPFGGFSRVAARAASSLALITVSGEQSFSPPLASFRVGLLGVQLEGRLIGTTLYLYEPFVASFDGHRPWVEKPDQHLERAVGVELGTLGARPGSPATQAFGGLVEGLSRARSIRELGTRTVDGQATIGFDAIVEAGSIGDASGPQRRALAKLVQPFAHLEVFVAEDGLPLRALMRLVLREGPERHRGERTELTIQSDILAVNVPVVVAPPPAGEVISQAQLARLEAAQAKRLARIRRARREGPRSLTG